MPLRRRMAHTLDGRDRLLWSPACPGFSDSQVRFPSPVLGRSRTMSTGTLGLDQKRASIQSGGVDSARQSTLGRQASAGRATWRRSPTTSPRRTMNSIASSRCHAARAGGIEGSGRTLGSATTSPWLSFAASHAPTKVQLKGSDDVLAAKGVVPSLRREGPAR